MRRYVIAYAFWLLGVLSAAALALYYYRRVAAIGEAALAHELKKPSPPGGPRRTSSPSSGEAPVLQAGDIEEDRPPSVEDVIRRRGLT